MSATFYIDPMCFSLISVAVIKHHDKKQSGKWGIISSFYSRLHIVHQCMEVRQELQTSTHIISAVMSREKWIHKPQALTSFLVISFLSPFLYSSGQPCSWTGPAHRVLHLSTSIYLFKTIFNRHTHKPTQVTLNCIKLTIKDCSWIFCPDHQSALSHQVLPK